MPLRIKLPAGERIVVNGAVIESTNENASLLFHNHVDILRRKEIMSEEEANSPARRMYYNMQCAYLFKEQRADFLKNYNMLRDQFLQAAPSSALICASVDELILSEAYYDAIRVLQMLIEHEGQLILSLAEGQNIFDNNQD